MNSRTALLIYAVLYLVFVYLPIFFIAVFSLNDSFYMYFPLQGITLDWYRQMMADAGIGAALWSSLQIAIIVAFLSVVFGTCAAKALTGARLPGRFAMILLIASPLIIPQLILGVAMLTLLIELDLNMGLATIGFGHLIFCLPFATFVMMARLEGSDPSLEEAARDLGQTSLGAFRRVTLPLALPGLLASFLLTFMVSMDEFIIATFLRGSDTTLPLFIYGQIRFPRTLPLVLSLGTCIVVGGALIVWISELLLRRDRTLERAAE